MISQYTLSLNGWSTEVQEKLHDLFVLLRIGQFGLTIRRSLAVLFDHLFYTYKGVATLSTRNELDQLVSFIEQPYGHTIRAITTLCVSLRLGPPSSVAGRCFRSYCLDIKLSDRLKLINNKIQ